MRNAETKPRVLWETREQKISEKLKLVLILQERITQNNITSHSVAGIIWRMSRLSIFILHFIWDCQRRGIKEFTSTLPQGQNSQLPANQPAAGKMLQVEPEVLFLTHTFSLLQNPSFSTAWIWFANYSFPSMQKKKKNWEWVERSWVVLRIYSILAKI